MSDSIRTDEIEKFLSSVRGFVTGQAAVPQRRRVKSELLVLTPANRVEEDVDDLDPNVAESPMEYRRLTTEPTSNVLHLDTGKQSDRENLEATIAELEEAVPDEPEKWELEPETLTETDSLAERAFQTLADDSLDPSPEGEDEPPLDEAATDFSEPSVDTDLDQNDASPAATDIASQIAQEVAKAFGVEEVARNIMSDMEDDTLRLMVTEIIREELAGELGEKITRNVRKLVRREINRAFMARGMD
ncbi:MAG: hypothetical protein AAFQ09_03965 [Pseudomonadota bacterium]